MSLRVYLNPSAWMRPFDDQQVLQIKAEAEAVKEVFRQSNIMVLRSRFLIRQFDYVPSPKTAAAKALAQKESDFVVTDEGRARQGATPLVNACGLSDWEDAVHLILASLGSSDYFITADSELFRDKRDCIENYLASRYTYLTKILDPIGFTTYIRGRGQGYIQ